RRHRPGRRIRGLSSNGTENLHKARGGYLGLSALSGRRYPTSWTKHDHLTAALWPRGLQSPQSSRPCRTHQTAMRKTFPIVGNPRDEHGVVSMAAIGAENILVPVVCR